MSLTGNKQANKQRDNYLGVKEPSLGGLDKSAFDCYIVVS